MNCTAISRLKMSLSYNDNLQSLRGSTEQHQELHQTVLTILASACDQSLTVLSAPAVAK